VVVADEQTGGRGRLSRRWESPPGSGIYFSILSRPALPSRSVHLVNIAAALAVAEAVQELSGISLMLKWPNDLLRTAPSENGEGEDAGTGAGAGKVCGILSESVFSGIKLDYCVTGIGVNLRTPKGEQAGGAHHPQLKGAAWLDCDDWGLPNPGDAIVSATVRSFFAIIDGMERHGTSGIIETYRRKCASIGRIVTATTGDESVTGLCTGIGSDGELILDTPLGERAFNVADVVHARLGA
jgi:BirA family biotin operon repressor/biotin-[acetyl-CoA-carboxylase] ligase